MSRISVKVHWHLGYVNKTACGVLSYPTNMTGEFDTVSGFLIECSNEERKVTCLNCQRVMLLGKWAVPADRLSRRDAP